MFHHNSSHYYLSYWYRTDRDVYIHKLTHGRICRKTIPPSPPLNTYRSYMLYCVILQVKWQTVLWGVGLQFVFALIVLRWPAGYTAFKWLGDRFTEFLAYSDAGAAFVFGPSFRDHFFAFQVAHLRTWVKRTCWRKSSVAESDSHRHNARMSGFKDFEQDQRMLVKIL